MQVYEGLPALTTFLTSPNPSTTVAIGAFDGIHTGHQAIIRTAVDDARAHDRPAIVFTFDRHPAELLRPDRAPDYITTPEQRIQLIEQLDADAMVIAQFDTALSILSPEEFVRDILVGLLGAKTLVIGADFCFGQNRAGDVTYLKSVCDALGFEVIALDPIAVGEIPASSTRIRELLQSGEIASAEAVLAHPFLLAGTVVKGKQLGRTIGYPTVNLERTCRQVVPGDGIYAVRVELGDGRIVDGACSIGTRPTVEAAGARTIETFLLDFNEDLYGQTIKIRFVRRLRSELKFESLDALKSQIALDVIRAREVLAE